MVDEVLFLSDEWVRRFKEAVQNSPSYREAAKTWEGDITLAIQADPEVGIESDLFLYIISPLRGLLFREKPRSTPRLCLFFAFGGFPWHRKNIFEWLRHSASIVFDTWPIIELAGAKDLLYFEPNSGWP